MMKLSWSWWNRAIRCEWGNTSWKIGETRCWSSKRSMASTIRHWKRRNCIRIVSRIKIKREQGEWSSANKTETNFKCYRRWRETFYDLENVHVFNVGNHLYSWERITWTIVNPLRTQQISHSNKCSTYLQDWCPNKMRFLEWKQLIGKIIHGSICLWLVMKKSSVFSAQRSTSFSDSVLCLGKIRENPQSNTA